MTRNYRPETTPSDPRPTVIVPVRREVSIFAGWGVKV